MRHIILSPSVLSSRRSPSLPLTRTCVGVNTRREAEDGRRKTEGEEEGKWREGGGRGGGEEEGRFSGEEVGGLDINQPVTGKHGEKSQKFTEAASLLYSTSRPLMCPLVSPRPAFPSHSTPPSIVRNSSKFPFINNLLGHIFRNCP